MFIWLYLVTLRFGLVMGEDGMRDRIRKIMQMEGLSNKELAEKVDVLPQNLSQALSGSRSIPSRTLTNICEAFPEIRKEWLLWGDGEMYKVEQQAVNTERLLDEATKVNTKPRLPITAAAGVLSDYLGGVLAHECEEMPVIRSIPDYDFTMLVKGNSMEPKYEGGDEIALKKVNSIIEPGKTYVLSTRDGAVLKRLYPDDKGVRCVSYNNEEYPDFYVSGDDVLGVYRVVGLIRI